MKYYIQYFQIRPGSSVILAKPVTGYVIQFVLKKKMLFKNSIKPQIIAKTRNLATD